MQDRLSHEELPPEEEPWYKGPIRIILALFLLLLLIIWFFPANSIKVDPEPKNIPSLEEVLPNQFEAPPLSIMTRQDYKNSIEPRDPIIKEVADRIVTTSCDGSQVCYAKAIYYFVRDNFQYVSDPSTFDYVKSARESLRNQGGDCDDAAVLAANLLEAIGIHTRFVFIPGHVYIQAYLPEAAKRYKRENLDYVSLDLTCTYCDFGELPYSDMVDNKVIVG